MIGEALFQTFKRYRTLKTDRIFSLPIVILIPHSACNCRCIMCDIWKDNKNLKQLTESDIYKLLSPLQRLGTRRVLMSGGEALLNPHFFKFCEMLKKENIKVTLLSTGLTLKKNAKQLVEYIHDIIISLDGDEQTHDSIRNIPGAYNKLKEGIAAIRSINPNFIITGRTVIHRLNFKKWPEIIDSAREIELDQISFLPADISSHAFNREMLWDENRKQEIALAKDELPELKNAIDNLLIKFQIEFKSKFIAEHPLKIKKIYDYYAAFYNLNPFPYKKCNAPWVSTVVEADGTVRPCFFHKPFGNMHTDDLEKILNSDKAIEFRKHLDVDTDCICEKCVCYLNLLPGTVL